MPEPLVVPKTTEVEDAEQGRSTIRFPYLDQDDAVRFAKAIRETAGNSCTRDALAGHLKVSAKAGGFNLRAVTAKMFGFVESDKGNFALTALGKQVIDPKLEKGARAESFLLIPLYKRVFDEYRNDTLPSNAALEKAIEKMGVAPKQTDKARQALQRSASQAGYFAYGTDRLIAPVAKTPASATTSEENVGTGGGSVTGSGGSGGGPLPPSGLDPVIAGLLGKLPEPNSRWPKEGRRRWLQTLVNAIDLVYTAPDEDGGELSVVLKTSAM
jgi:hypothetical protein